LGGYTPGHKQFLNKPSGDVGPSTVTWITSQGARFELLEFFDRRAVSSVLADVQVYAVRYRVLLGSFARAVAPVRLARFAGACSKKPLGTNCNGEKCGFYI